MEPLARRKFYLHRYGNPAAGGLWVVNASRAANIDNEKSRPASPRCAKVVVAASALANSPSLSNLQDAHSLMKQFWKMAKKEMCYRNFNHGSDKKLARRDVITIHFGDAGNTGVSRRDGSATCGYIADFAEPGTLNGEVAKTSLMDGKLEIASNIKGKAQKIVAVGAASFGH